MRRRSPLSMRRLHDARAGRTVSSMTSAIAGCELKPLTHMESITGFGVGNDLASATAVHERGIGVWATGRDVYDALTSLYHLEYLAQTNSVVAADRGVRGIAREDSDKLWSQFRGHHHYHEFFDSLDPGPLAHPYEPFLR